MPSDNLIHYVKFLRGTIAAYEKLKTNNQLDSDTLYFVYTNASANKGLLYLGEKLISGSSESGTPSEISIAELSDVVINDQTLADAQLLVYDNNSGNWVNKSLDEIISTAVSVMEGPTAIKDGKSGLVPQPKIGDEGKFLRGDGSWVSINVPSFDSKQFEVSNQKVIIKGSSTAEENQVLVSDGQGGVKFISLAIGKLEREVVDSTDDIDLTANDKIYLVRKTGETPADDSYDEYTVVNGVLERLGGSNVNLSGYATESFVQKEIGDLSKVIGDLSKYSENNTLSDAIDAINERLTWNEIPE